MGLKFEADKPRIYSELRVMMGELYTDINIEFFGPVATNIINSKENLMQRNITNIKQTITKDKNMKNKGKNWLHEKVNDMRQNYSKSVVNSTAQKMKFSFKDFFSKCDQIRRRLQIW